MKKKKDNKIKATKFKLVRVDSLKQGPIRHETLSDEILKMLNIIYHTVGHYTASSLEEFETSFMRDLHPESEVKVWCLIAAAWIKYLDLYDPTRSLSYDDCRILSCALIAISAGSSDKELLSLVTKEQLDRLKYCYNNPAEGNGLVDGHHRL